MDVKVSAAINTKSADDNVVCSFKRNDDASMDNVSSVLTSIVRHCGDDRYTRHSRAAERLGAHQSNREACDRITRGLANFEWMSSQFGRVDIETPTNNK